MVYQSVTPHPSLNLWIYAEHNKGINKAQGFQKSFDCFVYIYIQVGKGMQPWGCIKKSKPTCTSFHSSATQWVADPQLAFIAFSHTSPTLPLYTCTRYSQIFIVNTSQLALNFIHLREIQRYYICRQISSLYVTYLFS